MLFPSYFSTKDFILYPPGPIMINLIPGFSFFCYVFRFAFPILNLYLDKSVKL